MRPLLLLLALTACCLGADVAALTAKGWKVTDKGGVNVAVDSVDGNFEISVSDTGPGIADADQGRIFEEFQQVDLSSTRKAGGTGLGLAIARRIVEMHGGRISVTSVVGSGSTFRIVIPIRVEATVAQVTSVEQMTNGPTS